MVLDITQEARLELHMKIPAEIKKMINQKVRAPSIHTVYAVRYTHTNCPSFGQFLLSARRYMKFGLFALALITI